VFATSGERSQAAVAADELEPPHGPLLDRRSDVAAHERQPQAIILSPMVDCSGPAM